jgi:hypothetical protein
MQASCLKIKLVCELQASAQEFMGFVLDVSELLKNQTCMQFVHHLQLFCKFLAKLANDWNAFLIAANHSCACHTNNISLIGRTIAKHLPLI